MAALKAVLKPVEEQKKVYRSFIEILIDNFIKEIEAGEVVLQSIEDIETLMKLDLLLIGEPVDRVNNTSTVELPDKLRNLLDAKIKELKEESCTESE